MDRLQQSCESYWTMHDLVLSRMNYHVSQTSNSSNLECDIIAWSVPGVYETWFSIMGMWSVEVRRLVLWRVYA